MEVAVYDTEANGLLDEATKMHCAVVKYKGELIRFTPSNIGGFVEFISRLPTDCVIVCHNQIGFDLPLLKKLFGYEHKGRVLDTLVFSRLLQPERKGRHSLDAWGERLGRKKPEHEDWSTYTPAMLHRCEEDVEINYLVYKYLMKEAELSEEELDSLPMY